MCLFLIPYPIAPAWLNAYSRHGIIIQARNLTSAQASLYTITTYCNRFLLKIFVWLLFMSVNSNHAKTASVPRISQLLKVCGCVEWWYNKSKWSNTDPIILHEFCYDYRMLHSRNNDATMLWAVSVTTQSCALSLCMRKWGNEEQNVSQLKTFLSLYHTHQDGLSPHEQPHIFISRVEAWMEFLPDVFFFLHLEAEPAAQLGFI